MQHLDISACRRVSNEELANLPKMPHLRGVVLSGCEDISDEGMLHLAQITRLTALNMSNCCKVRACCIPYHATAVMESITSLHIKNSIIWAVCCCCQCWSTADLRHSKGLHAA